MGEYHRDPGLSVGLGLNEYQYPEYGPYGGPPPHPSMYHHSLGPPPQHLMGPGPSNTSAFQPAGAPMQGQHDLVGGKWTNSGTNELQLNGIKWFGSSG